MQLGRQAGQGEFPLATGSRLDRAGEILLVVGGGLLLGCEFDEGLPLTLGQITTKLYKS